MNAEMGIVVWPKSMQNKDVSENENFSTMEVQNYNFCILDTCDRNEIVQSLEWCEAEFEERTSPMHVNPGTAYKLRPEIWNEFINEYGEFDYTYNERISRQLHPVIEELRRNPDTRRAIVIVYDNVDTEEHMSTLTRIPCSMHYQLMVRRGKLDIIYNMRSSDFDTHFRHDIWQACQLRDWIAAKVGIEPGLFFMNIGSLHRYKNYHPGVFEVLT